MFENLKRTSRSESVATAATGAAFSLIVLDTSIVNLTLPRIRHVFHADLTALQWLAALALAAASALAARTARQHRLSVPFTLHLVETTRGCI